ncbi:MAG: 30S ribosomal protein S12 methylthiotransferase RimO [Deltaproteobacteria bacterium]|nr:30S ribosomal protein S12 methylthiotransferase RimO [Deltaproteobacteria bacterium]
MKLHFISLGCPKNLVDSEVMLGQLTGVGYELVEDPNKAQIIVINTCAFIEDAKKEAIDTILEMTELKKSGSCKLLMVAGCLPQRYEGELSELFPEVDVFIGTGEFYRVAQIVEDWDGKPRNEIKESTFIYDHETARLHTSPHHSAYLKIAEGCFHPCSFRIIPKIRGKFRSRPVDSIVEEARGMLAKDIKEINLIAQDLTAYGKDIKTDLASLLEGLVDLEGSERWFRLLYTYPHKFPADVIEIMRDCQDICSYIDLPIQHINDRVLKRMKRKGGGKEIRKLLEEFRKKIPNVSIRTSLIVGFPGETQEEFDELLDFVGEARFEHLGVFTFSPEEGTPAAKLKDQVPHDVAIARQTEIMELQKEVSLSNNNMFLGKIVRVLVEGSSDETDMLLQARHEGQAPEFDGVIYINEGLAAAGDFAYVEITEAHHYDLVGKVVG